ncbi:major capsid protein [Proteus phage Saba]|uniref:Major capsid protein n=1 Tax=Proteus phage Saba TaxID=2596672 RepID=A0A5B9N9G0_9CAUD|nr:major head protein [Proteus phage Saba]QEG09435.1 major capsid protein [Proteus phage Saba]
MAGQYTTVQLLPVLRQVKSLPSFFLSYFPNQINFTTDEVALDKVSDNYKRVAPFVAPNVQGRIIKEKGFTGVAFKPAYLKPKDVIDPSMAFPRRPGEDLAAGSLTPDQRFKMAVAESLKKQKIMIENSWEIMAAQALIYGYVDIESEDYPYRRVDFRRDPALTITTDWTAGGITSEKTFEDLRLGRQLVNDKSASGTVVRDYIFGQEAWDLFAKVNKDILFGDHGLMDTRFKGSETLVTRIQEGLEGVEYLGRIAGVNGSGAMDIYVNTQKYFDQDNKEQYIVPQGGVVGVSRAVEGYRCFGAIYDKKAGFQSLAMFPKQWEEEDPAVDYLMTQSAPLMVPRDPNTTFLIMVKK